MNDGMGGEVDADVAGRIMSLMLDCADPSNDADRRDDAFEQAMDLNPIVTAVVAAGYLWVILNGLHVQFGPAASAHLVSHLAEGSVRLLDPDEEDA
ncbi:hypothetical protein AB0F72_09175 [Actinoplanes sp. NPDC023936]|uniref:hypothetical protein n=1 Tax=Actinoplanes sp. NPDC023936 TaxID=3154910 RepID=UPI0033E2E089